MELRAKNLETGVDSNLGSAAKEWYDLKQTG